MLFAFSGESLARTNKKGFGLFVLVSSKASVQCVPVWQFLTSHSHVVCQLDGGGGADLAGVLPAVHLLGQADHQLTPVVGLLHFAPEQKMVVRGGRMLTGVGQLMTCLLIEIFTDSRNKQMMLIPWYTLTLSLNKLALKSQNRKKFDNSLFFLLS